MFSASLVRVLSRVSERITVRMLRFFTIGFLFFYVPTPIVLADCPSGTRNNYKGECITVEYQTDNARSTVENKKKWVEPTGEINKVEQSAEQTSQSRNTISDSTISESVPDVEVEEVSIDTNNNSSAPDVEVEEVSIDTNNNSSAPDVEKDKIIRTDNIGTIQTISLIQELREEIQELLNRIELQRYELEKLRARQIDLYQDLDNRVRTQERLTLAVPSPEMPSVDAIVNRATEADAVVDAPSPLIVEENIEELVEDRSSGINNSPNPIVTGDVDGNENIVKDVAMRSPAFEENKETVVTEIIEPVIFSKTVETAIETNQESSQQVTATSWIKSSKDLIAIDDLSQEEHLSVMLGPEKNDPTEWATSFSEQLTPTPSRIVSDVAKKDNTIEESSNSSQASNLADASDNTATKTEANGKGSINSTTQSAEVQKKSDEGSVVLSTTVSLGEQEAYDQAFNMLKQSRYEEAALEFANFLRYYKNSQLTDDAWYWMAEAYYVSQDFDQALRAFQTVVTYFSNSPRIPASRLKIGYIQYEISDYQNARDTLKTLLEDFPAHRVAVSAEARLRKMDRENK